MAHDVFISYSHKDKAVADAICARLESEGVRCWYAPRDIVPGADWAASIIDAIKTSKMMVLIFTDFSNASNQVLREVNSAVSNKLPIIPFKLTETLPTEGMQYYLGAVHWLDAMNEPLEKSIDELLRLAQAILTGTAPEPSEKKFEQAAPTGEPAKSGKKKLVVPVVVGIVVLVAVVVGAFVLLGGQGTSTSSSAADVAASSTTVENATQKIADEVDGKGVNVDDPTNSGTMGNLQCNYLNDGIATTDGTWIYYQSNDAQSIYKMRMDGSEKTKLNDQPSSQLGVIDGKLYYRTSSGIYSMDVNGGDSTNLFMGTTEDMMIVDKRIYFKASDDKLHLYSMAMDGSDIKCENKLEEVYSLNIWDGKMYWSNRNDAGKLYCANLDGSDAAVLTTSSVDVLRVADGWLFYCDTTKLEERAIKIDTNESYLVFPDNFYESTISKHGLIGGMSTDGQRLYRVRLGSSGANLLLGEDVTNTCVVGDYVFYEGEDHQIHRISADGTNGEVL